MVTERAACRSRELTYRELNRALLARQGLLTRETVAEAELIERLVGLQAQVPDAPYVGLWSRIADFRPDVLPANLAAGRVIRMTLMRSTLPLVTARDALVLEPTFREMVVRRMRGSDRSRGLAGISVRRRRP